MRLFITGLPRTRSYWLSQYFNTFPDVLAHHELTNLCSTKEALYEYMNAPGTVINCDSGLWVTDFRMMFPDAKVAIVERPLLDAFHSCWEFLDSKGFAVNPTLLLESMQLAQQALDSFPVDLRVHFDDLDSSGVRELTELAGLTYSPQIHDAANAVLPHNMPTVEHNAEALKLWCPNGLVERSKEVTRRKEA